MAAAAIHILAVIAHYVFERRNLLACDDHWPQTTRQRSGNRSYCFITYLLAVLVTLASLERLLGLLTHAPAPLDDSFY